MIQKIFLLTPYYGLQLLAYGGNPVEKPFIHIKSFRPFISFRNNLTNRQDSVFHWFMFWALLKQQKESLGPAMLNQKICPGLGNIIKNEACALAKLNPGIICKTIPIKVNIRTLIYCDQFVGHWEFAEVSSSCNHALWKMNSEFVRKRQIT